MKDNRLFVGNLSFDTTENDLQDMFSQIAPVSEVNLIMDRATNRSRGFAFVTMATPEGAQLLASAKQILVNLGKAAGRDVLVDPDHLNRYWVDTSFLPKMA